MKKNKVSGEYTLWNKDKCPITSLASLPLLVKEMKKKAYCLSTSVPVFLLPPLLSAIVCQVSWLKPRGQKKFAASLQVCTKPLKKF